MLGKLSVKLSEFILEAMWLIKMQPYIILMAIFVIILILFGLYDFFGVRMC